MTRMSPSRALSVALLLAIAASAGCSPHFSGEYDGQATLSLGAAHGGSPSSAPLTFPVHVRVGAKSFELKGAPLTSCSPMVVEVSRRHGMMLQFQGAGACSVTSNGKTFALADGAGIASFDGDKLQLSFNGTDALSVDATRKK